MSIGKLSELLVFWGPEKCIILCFILTDVKWCHENNTTWDDPAEMTDMEKICSVLGLYGQISFTGHIDSQ